MDGFDEKKHDGRRDDDDVTAPRSGDVLGLGHGPVPKAPGDPSAQRELEEGHEESGFGDIERPSGTRDTSRTPGATGIDMGSGGSGTDVTGR